MEDTSGLPSPQPTGDVHDELAVVEYAEEIYNLYKLTEDQSQVLDYMDSQPDITAELRKTLIDWLLNSFHRELGCKQESFYVFISILDRYLSMKIVSMREFWLVGLSSMRIACKYVTRRAPKVGEFISRLEGSYTLDEIFDMESAILGLLGWKLTVPTPYEFLVRYIRASVSPDQEMENTAFLLAELGLAQYQMIRYSSSMIAAAAVYAARRVINESSCRSGTLTYPCWSETLSNHSGYSEEQIMECVELLVGFYEDATAESDEDDATAESDEDDATAESDARPDDIFNIN